MYVYAVMHSIFRPVTFEDHKILVKKEINRRKKI